MPVSREFIEKHGTPFIHRPGDATVGEALRTYRQRGGQWSWLLTTEHGGRFRVCSYGSLLPYLTGRTPHIVHNIGDCAICMGMDPVLWQGTDALVDEALARRAIRARRLAALPMADLPAVAGEDVTEGELEMLASRQDGNACGLTLGGELVGVYVVRYRGDEGGMPSF